MSLSKSQYLFWQTRFPVNFNSKNSKCFEQKPNLFWWTILIKSLLPQQTTSRSLVRNWTLANLLPRDDEWLAAPIFNLDIITCTLSTNVFEEKTLLVGSTSPFLLVFSLSSRRWRRQVLLEIGALLPETSPPPLSPSLSSSLSLSPSLALSLSLSLWSPRESSQRRFFLSSLEFAYSFNVWVSSDPSRFVPLGIRASFCAFSGWWVTGWGCWSYLWVWDGRRSLGGVGVLLLWWCWCYCARLC